jgi:hypothetical protein
MAIDINSTVLEPVSKTMESLMSWIQVLVGGFFGLYVISFILRWREQRKLNRMFKEIHSEIRKINKRLSKR